MRGGVDESAEWHPPTRGWSIIVEGCTGKVDGEVCSNAIVVDLPIIYSAHSSDDTSHLTRCQRNSSADR